MGLGFCLQHALRRQRAVAPEARLRSLRALCAPRRALVEVRVGVRIRVWVRVWVRVKLRVRVWVRVKLRVRVRVTVRVRARFRGLG